MNVQLNGISEVRSSKEGLFINGEKVKTPKGMNIFNSAIVNKNIYIGGYKWIAKKKKFKITFWSIWHYLFYNGKNNTFYVLTSM